MKYLLLLGDGMSDFPIKELDNRTPLEVANKPYMNYMAANGIQGLVRTVPAGMPPGSDIANLSLLGYNPKNFYTGRSPLEASSIGVDLLEDSVAIRCNLVTLSDDLVFEEKVLIDYSAGEISNSESRVLMEYINEKLSSDNYSFYHGTSYRNCFVLKHGEIGTIYTPPHDISGEKIKDYFPKGIYGEAFSALIKKSYELLSSHPINIERVKKGLRPANCIWFWGEGRKPSLKDFYSIYKKRGAIISAVDLLKGIAINATMKVVEVEGATGTLSTNYEGKALAAINEFKQGADFVYLHVEASDECSHQKDLKGKIKAIEYLDSRILSIIFDKMKEFDEGFSILVLPDHPTPLSTGTHSADPVPFVLFNSMDVKKSKYNSYCEKNATESKIFFEDGPSLLNFFFQNKNGD